MKPMFTTVTSGRKYSVVTAMLGNPVDGLMLKAAGHTIPCTNTSTDNAETSCAALNRWYQGQMAGSQSRRKAA